MRAMRLFPTTLILPLLWPGTGWGRGDDEADSYVKDQVASRKVPGLSVAVVREGKVVFAGGYGLANVELSVPATPDTVFELASVSKQFTAAAILLLVEDGKLGLDDLVVDRLSGLPKAWGGITVRHLLGHTSGIADYLATPGLSLRADYPGEALIRLVADAPPAFPPGTRWAYSNTNYVLLGRIVEEASGQTLAAFSQARIFGPLKMAATRINDTRAIIPDRATGYEREGGTLRIRDWISPTLAATGDGGVVSSARDLAKWVAALEGGALLGPTSLRQMWTPGRLADGKATGYGFGWALGDQSGHRLVEHAGGFPGFSTDVALYPDDKLAVIVLANTSSANAVRIARGVAGRFVTALAEPEPKPGAPAGGADPKRTARHKDLLAAWQAGTLDPNLFTPEAKAALFPGPMAGIGRELARMGPIGPFEPLGEEEANGLTTHRYRATLGKTVVILSLSLDGDGKIAGVLATPE